MNIIENVFIFSEQGAGWYKRSAFLQQLRIRSILFFLKKGDKYKKHKDTLWLITNTFTILYVNDMCCRKLNNHFM
jgi:hypothetical protein